MAKIYHLHMARRLTSDITRIGLSGWQQSVSLSSTRLNGTVETSSDGKLIVYTQSLAHVRNTASQQDLMLVKKFRELSLDRLVISGRLNASSLHQNSALVSRTSEICNLLPMNRKSSIGDHSIVNGVLYDKSYQLPVYNKHITLEEIAPPRDYANSSITIDPVPAVINSRLDPTVTIRKEAKKMSVLRIRHKKMKKHKRRKLLKRTRFILRKKRAAKAKRKEKALQDFEMAQARWARDFDAEKVIDSHLEKAREAGWGIDILAERKVSASGQN